MDRETLLALSKDDLVALVLAQHDVIEKLTARIHTLTARVAELEAKLNTPAKTPDNSSLPPSKGQKPNLPERGQKKPRPSRPGVPRKLAEHPDKVIEASLSACPHCAHPLSLADQPHVHAYDHIDLPPIRPVVPFAAFPSAAPLEPLAATPASTAIAAPAPAAASALLPQRRRGSNPARRSAPACAR